MNILFLRSNPVDPDSRVEKEVNSLLKFGHKVSIYCWDREKDYRVRKVVKSFENGECTVYRIGIKAVYGGGMKKNLLPLIKFQISMLKHMKKNKNYIDVVHACDFDTGLVAKIMTKKFKKHLVYDIFDFYVDSYHVPNILKNKIKNLEYSVINSSATTIICTEERKKQIKGSKPNNLVVIHNTPSNSLLKDDNKEKDSKKEDSKNFSITYVGVLGGGRLITELVDIVNRHSDIILNIGGFGNLENAIKSKAKKSSNINYLGKIPYSSVLNIEKESTILTAIYDPKIANHKYAAPNKFYEGLMLGKPLIMVKGTGMSNIVEENNIGMLIDYTSNSLEQCILKLKGLNSNELDRMGVTMKKIYEKHYSWEVMEERLIKLYEELEK